MATNNNSRFKPIANPYIVGNPIEDRKMFFGREDDFEYIRKKIIGGKKGGLLVLCGTRRSGKTSILFQIKGGRLGKEFVPVLLDMQAMTVQDDGEFLARLALEIINVLDHPDISYKRDYLTAATDNPFNAFHALIQIINVKLPGKKLILMFDEYELFETHIKKGRFSTDILHLLANWMEHNEGVFVVFTGSDKLESRPCSYWSNFLGKALHRRISFLSKGDAYRLINDPLRELVTYEEGVVEEIYKLAAGQPFYSQVLCQSLIDLLNEQQKFNITSADVETVVTELIDNPLPQMIFSWGSLTDVEKLCLSSLAELRRLKDGYVAFDEVCNFPSDQKTGYRFDSHKLHETSERLFHQDLLIKEEGCDRFTFKMDLWYRWIARMHSIWQVIDEITEGGSRLGPGIRKDKPRKFSRWLISLGLIAIAVVYVAFKVLNPAAETEMANDGPPPIAFVPHPAWVSIKSVPPRATVLLDDLRLGQTPLLREVAAGTYVLNLELVGYRSHTDTLTLAKADTTFQEYSLDEITGGLRITSSPIGAGIVLDGHELGVTPCIVLALNTDEQHSIRLSRTSYHDMDISNITVLGDTTITIYRRLKQIMHPLIILSRPDSARVFLDGDEVGTTLFNSPAVHDGKHQLELRKTGYHDLIRTITVPVPSNQRTFNLEPLPPGTLVFRFRYYAEIRINGEVYVKDVPNWSREFPPGVYNIELRHPLYEPEIRTIQLKTGVTETIQWQFDEIEEQR